jgi:ribosomal protein L37AE/L43A
VNWFLGVVAFTALASAGTLAWYSADQKRRRDAVLAQRDDDSRCASCGSTELRALGPGAYRCSACDYEGGSEIGKLLESDESVVAERLDEGERHRRADPFVREATEKFEEALRDIEGATPKLIAQCIAASTKARAALQHALRVWEEAEQVLDEAGVDAFEPPPLGDDGVDELLRTPSHRDTMRAWILRQQGGVAALRAALDAPSESTSGGGDA